MTTEYRPLSEAELDAIEARLEAAANASRDVAVRWVYEDGLLLAEGKHGSRWTLLVYRRVPTNESRAHFAAPEIGRFVAASLETECALLAEVRRLRKALGFYRSGWDEGQVARAALGEAPRGGSTGPAAPQGGE